MEALMWVVFEVALLVLPVPITLVALIWTKKPLRSVVVGTLPTTLIAFLWALRVTFWPSARGVPVGMTEFGPEAFQLALVVSLTALALSSLSTIVSLALRWGFLTLFPSQQDDKTE